ncbi:hypothetical protein BDV98DRAFT_575679 [Pterulicium gracile]|uniref:Uncharacterized protein n=1 Tax=Pterulicium gracile TaxID=1884261 RepID=A0A5C3Q569_9AGAR|nr:hypothetical protein BDV98DRAFT_575679 [Pterula gracilis]
MNTPCSTLRTLLYASALCYSPVMAQIGQRKRTNTNRIIAGVVVAVAAVLFLVFLYFYLRHRRRRAPGLAHGSTTNGPTKVESHQLERPSPQTTNTFHASNTPYTKPHQNQQSSQPQDFGGYAGGTLGYDNNAASGAPHSDSTPYPPPSNQPYAPPAHPPPPSAREEQIPPSILKISEAGDGAGHESAHAPPPYSGPTSDSRQAEGSKSESAARPTYEPPNTPPPVATTSHHDDFVGGFRPH